MILPLLGLGIAHLPSWIGPLLRSMGVDLTFMGGPQAALVWNWAAVLALLLYMARVERRPLAGIGLRRPSGADLGWGVAAWALSPAVTVGAQALVPPVAGPGSGTATPLALPVLALAALALTTAATEEIVWRGYTIEALEDITGRRWLGAALSLAAFATPYVAFFGPVWLLHHGPGTMLLTGLHRWRRDLWPGILAHGLGNAMILLPVLGVGEP